MCVCVCVRVCARVCDTHLEEVEVLVLLVLRGIHLGDDGFDSGASRRRSCASGRCRSSVCRRCGACNETHTEPISWVCVYGRSCAFLFWPGQSEE